MFEVTNQLTTVEVLKQARDLLAGGWCQHRLAETTAEAGCYPDDPEATRFCVVGALVRATLLPGAKQIKSYFAAIDHLNRHVRQRHGAGSVPVWNNEPGRTQAEVVAFMEEAIVCLK